MSGIQNPEWKRHVDLGFTDAEWDALKTTVTDYLQANSGSSTIDETVLRLLDPELADDRVWNQLAGDLKLFDLHTGAV